jgi:DNA-binding GntR family transcriptional regulator
MFFGWNGTGNTLTGLVGKMREKTKEAASNLPSRATESAMPSGSRARPAAGGNANTRAYLLLKQAVFSGRFGPSQTITLRMVTEFAGVGEMPAREALKRLISEGAFEAMPNRSARVPVLAREEIAQLCELRVLLESKAAFLAAQNIDLHQIEHLRRMHEGMILCAANGDLQEYKKLNMAFHFEIYRIAGNKPLADLIEALWLRMAPFISRTISWVKTVPGRFDEVATQRHGELLSAFQTRNAEAAHLAMELDLSDIHETEGYWDSIAAAPK